MTAGIPPEISRLQSIRTFSELVEYLRDVLGWPINENTQEDEAFFEYDAAEVGLDEANAVRIERIRRLRPLVSGQPWGIFFIEFRPGKLPITVLRRILRALVVKKRAGSDRQRWQMGDLLFISILGDTGHRNINLAHFSDDGSGDGRAALRVVDWDEDDAHFHMLRTVDELNCLRWPDNTEHQDEWRDTWSEAFRLKPGQVAKTATQLATQMASLAKLIRSRVNAAMEIESEDGPLTRLYKAFKQVLVSDLTEDAFADMYAQTITYGLFAAHRSQPIGVTAETARDMVPNTNPFLRDLLGEFTDVGGATKSLDFDELGIDALVEVLNQADMDAVVADFDDKNPNEDPVIRFYEDFLRQYDKKMKVQRGIFFTPRPVVSFIVRSVDELLRTEFGLKDGLADTTTWGEMIKRHPDFALPEEAAPDTPFVQILDPAVGTGTFLVEVIDVIHRTMMKKWQLEGHLPMLDIPKRWNEYVAKHLLPRLYGFELMMAPYAIAHMKIGLKLSGTGYRFADEERLRIFLANTLDEPKDIGAQFEGMAPALAHEAAAANKIKRHTPITVVIGNPPYSGESMNTGDWIRNLIETYMYVDGTPLGEKGKKNWLQDDYVKFIRYSQFKLDRSGIGVLGFINNHGILDNPTFRGMRASLLKSLPSMRVLDLHGNAKKKERGPKGGGDANVFDIQQGVAIEFLWRSPGTNSRHDRGHAHLWGLRGNASAAHPSGKYGWLVKHSISTTNWTRFDPNNPFYLFMPQNVDLRPEYDSYWKLTEAMPHSGSGITTSRDHFVIDFEDAPLRKRLEQFRDPRVSDEYVRTHLEVRDNSMWSMSEARKRFRKQPIREDLFVDVLYRPFDTRRIYFETNVVFNMRIRVMRHLLKPNLSLVTIRRVEIDRGFEHVFCGNRLVVLHSASMKEANVVVPLFLYPDTGGKRQHMLADEDRNHNFGKPYLHALSARLELRQNPASNLPNGVTPEDIFHHAYAVFHSRGYRSRYAEFLKIDFPRLPLPSNLELFRNLARFGGELVSLHLMESPKLAYFITSYVGPDDPKIARVGWSDNAVWLDAVATKKGQSLTPGTIGFRGVPEDVWNFHIGGYQVCHKWLKDRKGRTLSKDDIDHYQRIVIALNETIRIMGEIDEVIDEHGGWPGAFQSADAEV